MRINFEKKTLKAYKKGVLYKHLGPLWVVIEPTNLCNLKCQMCDRWQWPLNKNFQKGKLSTQKLFSIFSQLKKLGTKEIVLTGGEFILRKDYQKIVEKIAGLKIKPMVYTNGYTFNRKTANCLAKHNADVSFSLDGFTPKTHDSIRGVKGSFEKVLSAIRILSEEKKKRPKNATKIVINYTIQKENVGDLKHALDFIKNLKVDLVRFAIVHGPGSFIVGKKDLKIIKNFIKEIGIKESNLKTKIVFSPFVIDLVEGKLNLKELEKGDLCAKLFKEKPVPCFISHYSMLIDAYGKVFPCLYTHYDTSNYDSFKQKRERFWMGDVFKNSLEAIWNSGVYNDFRQKVALVGPDTLPGVCSQCEYYYKFRDYLGIINKK